MDLEEVKEKLAGKKLVFTVATGRCGTAFLAEILRLVPGAVSLHEPKPEYAELLRQVQAHPELAAEFLTARKLPLLADINTAIYIETSHLFCKGFLEPLLELGIVPALIWMRRPHRAVASSMFRGGTIPGRTQKGLQFYLSPDDPGVLPCPDWQELNDYQLCYWYCLEMEQRAKKYRSLYRQNGRPWGETSITEITRVRGYRELSAAVGLPKLPWYGWLRYFNNRRRKVNPTSLKKQQVVLPADLDGLEAEVRSRVETCGINK
jgi:hypothetical protein